MMLPWFPIFGNITCVRRGSDVGVTRHVMQGDGSMARRVFPMWKHPLVV